MEAIQGEGGVNLLDSAFVKNICKICKEKDVLVIFDEVQNEADIVLAGHSLGGLIRLPFVHEIYSQANTGNYQKGIYKQKNSTLIVNGGIGTQKINARFNNIQEIVYHNMK